MKRYLNGLGINTIIRNQIRRRLCQDYVYRIFDAGAFQERFMEWIIQEWDWMEKVSISPGRSYATVKRNWEGFE